MADKTTKELWQDYRFLTKEMAKFLAKPDMNLFYDLMRQRAGLQAMIDAASDDGYKASPEGRSLLAELHRDNQDIMQRLQYKMNASQRQHQVADAYSGQIAAPVNRMSWNR